MYKVEGPPQLRCGWGGGISSWHEVEGTLQFRCVDGGGGGEVEGWNLESHGLPPQPGRHMRIPQLPSQPRPPSPLCRTLLAREQARIRQEYEEKMRRLEAEQQGGGEDRAQVGGGDGVLLAWVRLVGV